MKKLLVALMACVLLAGCGGKDTAEEKYTAGTYTGTAKGNNADVTVEVVVDASSIKEINITEHAETAGISDAAFEKVPAAIIEANGTEGVETVSGATNTSKAIISAVEAALAEASK